MDLVRTIITWTLILAGAYLFLSNSSAFNSILKTLGATWNNTLLVASGRGQSVYLGG